MLYCFCIVSRQPKGEEPRGTLTIVRGLLTWVQMSCVMTGRTQRQECLEANRLSSSINRRPNSLPGLPQQTRSLATSQQTRTWQASVHPSSIGQQSAKYCIHTTPNITRGCPSTRHQSENLTTTGYKIRLKWKESKKARNLLAIPLERRLIVAGMKLRQRAPKIT